MTKVNFYDSINDSMLKFAVIIARHNGKWVFCKHKERNEYYGAADSSAIIRFCLFILSDI